MQQQHPPLFKLLPGADNIGARLALLVLGCVLIGLVLFALAILEIFEYSPVEMEGDAFFWLTVWMAMVLLFFLIVLWIVINHDVLKPLRQISELSA